MQKIDLYVYRNGFFSLLELAPLPSQFSTEGALNTLSLEELVLIEWRGRITPQQVFTWTLRPYQKRYIVKLSLTLAVALRKLLRTTELTSDLQELSDELDRALVNNGLSTKTLSYNHV